MSPLSPPEDPARAVAVLGSWLRAENPQPLVITTSGSAGRPKRVLLSRAAVLASARASLERLGLPAGTRWVLELPSGYVAGVQVIVRALLGGSPPIPSAGGLPDQGPLAVSLVGTQVHRMLSERPERLARFHTVLLGGGPVDAEVRRGAERLGVRVVATYGASETAGGCVYDGEPLAGVRVRIGAGERIEIGGPVVFDGYLGETGSIDAGPVGGWFRTSDLGRLVDGRLEVLGRADDVVVSGGLNVPAPAVARRLRQHPSVREVEVLGVPDPEWGARVVAFVVGALSLEDARDWVGATLPRAWAPREIRVLAELPLLSNGKTDRQRLLESAR